MQSVGQLPKGLLDFSNTKHTILEAAVTNAVEAYNFIWPDPQVRK
jgi:hypothetical protein